MFRVLKLFTECDVSCYLLRILEILDTRLQGTHYIITNVQ